MVRLCVVLPTHIVLPTIDTATKPGRLNGKPGGVDGDDILLFQRDVLENNFIVSDCKTDTFEGFVCGKKKQYSCFFISTTGVWLF